MHRVLYLSLFVLACAVPAFAQDPVKVDPDHYKTAINNGQVRVLMIHYGPHEKSKMHWHPNSVAIPQTSGKVRMYLPGGKHTDMDMVAGQANVDAGRSAQPRELERQRHGRHSG